MPQLQVLQPNPSFGSQLGEALGQGFGGGISQGINLYYQQKEKKKKEAEKLEKSKLSAQKDLPKLIKEYFPELEGNPQALKNIRENVFKSLEKEIPLSNAYMQAFSDYEKQSPFLKKEDHPSGAEASNLREMLSLPTDISPESKGFYRPPQETGVPGGVAGLAAQHPLQALAALPRGGLRFLEGLASIFKGPEDLRALTSPEKVGGPGLPAETPSEFLSDVTGLSRLSPEMQEEAEVLSGLTELLPLGGGAKKLLSGIQKSGFGKFFNRLLQKNATKTGETAAKTAEKAFEGAKNAGIDLEKVAEGAKKETKRLYDWLREKETPTTARAERVEKGTPKFVPKEEVILRETQLKEFPKYEREISKDALERAERLERQTPKTEKGMVGLQQRRAKAQSELPRINELYRNAIARNRALEDAYIKAAGEEKNRLKPLLEHSRKNLKESEDAYRQTLSNAKQGTSKKGESDLTKAAQQKILDLQDEIGEGKPIQLKKADYNPEMIREAERLKKLKEPSGHPTDKFYEKVHDQYEKVYQDRLEQLNKELKGLKGNIRSLSEAEKFRNLQKEKEILEKMVKQTQAEKLIHRRKLRLREIAERKKAEERLKKLKKAQGEPKVSQASSERFEQIRKSPEFEKANEKIKKEGDSLKESLDQVKKIENEKEASSKINSRLEGLKKDFQELKEKFPEIWKSKLGQDILTGMAAAVYDDLVKEYELPITRASWVSLLLGRRGRGYAIRAVSNQLTKSVIKSIHLQNIKEAYRKGDREKILEYQKKYSSTLMKKGRQKAFSEE